MEAHEYETLARVEAAHPWFVNRRRLVRGMVRRFAGHLTRPRILDAGSGTGANLADYAAWGPVVGIELDQAAASISRRTVSVPVAVGNLCRLPFPDRSFDLVISTDVIEHIEDDVAALTEMARVLVPHGHIVLTTPAYSWAYSSHDRFLHHVRRYDTIRFKSAIESAGLRIVHHSRYNVLLAAPLLLARWVGDRWSRGRQRGSDVGRPVPRLLARVLYGIFAVESFLAVRMNLRIGLTHVAVLGKA